MSVLAAELNFVHAAWAGHDRKRALGNKERLEHAQRG